MLWHSKHRHAHSSTGFENSSLATSEDMEELSCICRNSQSSESSPDDNQKTIFELELKIKWIWNTLD